MNYLSKFINYFNSLDSLIFIGVMIIILVFLFIFMMESSTGRNILESRHMESFPNISGIPDDKLLAKLVTQIISRKSGSFQGNIYSPIWRRVNAHLSVEDEMRIIDAAFRAQASGALDSYSYKMGKNGKLCYNTTGNKAIASSQGLIHLIQTYGDRPNL